MKYFDMIKPNIDSFGVITQNGNDSWDGGDTTQREGMFMCAMYYHMKAGRITQDEYNQMGNRYIGIMDHLEYSNWKSVRRHPDPSKWYHDVDRMSRDQLVPNIVALGYWFDDFLLPMAMKHLFLRAGLFTTNTRENGAIASNKPSMNMWQRLKYAFGLYNPGVPCYQWKLPDITDPSIWGAYVRGLNWKLLWPSLLMSDWILVGGALMVRYGSPTNDQNTLQMLLLQSSHRMSTPVSKLAMWIYKKTNPQAALDSYFAPANNGPAMNDVYREIWSNE